MTPDRDPRQTSASANAEEDALLLSLLLTADDDPTAASTPNAAAAEERRSPSPPARVRKTTDPGPPSILSRVKKTRERSTPSTLASAEGTNGRAPAGASGTGGGDGPGSTVTTAAAAAAEPAMTLIDHLKELRTRLVWASIGVLAGMAVGMFLVLGPFNLVNFLIATFAPAEGKPYPPVQTVGTAEAFTSYMTVALTVGVILGMPVIVYQLLAFIVPGLTGKEKRAIFIALPFVIGFFLAGLAFGWFVTVPTAIHFLMGFSTSELIQIQPTLSNFIRTVTLLLVINGVVFELPIIIFVLALMGVVTAKQLSSYRRYAIVIVAIVAAIITPTGDPVNLALLAIPMYLLFELGVLMARLVPGRESGSQ